MVLYLFPALVVVTILLVAFGIQRIRNGDGKIADRLRQIRGHLQFDNVPMQDAFAGKPIPLLLRPLKLLGMLLPLQAGSEVLRWELASAGYRHPDGPKVFTGLRVAMTVTFCFGTLFALTKWTELLHNEVLLSTAVMTLLGFMGPWMMVRVRQNKRRWEITLALPDALDLLVICVEAGQGLNAALMSVTRESGMHSPALSDELRMVNLEMSTGMVRSQALRNLALRTGIDDVRGLVAVLVQSDKFGTSIAQALRTHAYSLRTRRRQRAEEAARKTPVKMVFPLVFCIFPALLTVLLAPGMMDLFKVLGSSQ
jgi:tight adherence protein C